MSLTAIHPVVYCRAMLLLKTRGAGSLAVGRHSRAAKLAASDISGYPAIEPKVFRSSTWTHGPSLIRCPRLCQA